MIASLIKVIMESDVEILDFIRHHIIRIFTGVIFIFFLVSIVTFADAPIYTKNQDGSGATKQENLSNTDLSARRDSVATRILELLNINASLQRSIQNNMTDITALQAELLQIDAATIKP